MTRNFSNYTLSGTSHEFLTSYAKRIEDYITANNLPKTYSDDIFDRLFEKLNTFQSQGNIKDANVIRVVNDIGEPEDIFREMAAPSSKNNFQNEGTTDHFAFLKTSFERIPEKGIVSGVCAGIADYYGIDVLWVRLAFVLFTLAWGVGVIIYFVLAVLLPKKTSILSERKAVSSQNGNTLDIPKNVSSFFNSILTLILRIIAFFLGLFGIFVVFGGIGVSGFLLAGGFQMGNQYFPASIPTVLVTGSVIVTLVSLFTVIGLLFYAFGKIIFKASAWIAIGALAGIGGILITSGGIQTIKEYAWQEKSVTEKVIVYSGSVLEIKNPSGISGTSGYIFEPRYWNIPRIERSPTAKDITIQTHVSLYAKDSATAKSILSQLPQTEYSLSGSTLIIGHSQGNIGTSVPFSFYDSDTTIIIPSGMQVQGDNYYPYNYYEQSR